MLATVATRLEQVATQQCVFQLWWVVGALLEALREQGVESSVSVKRLLGLADREIKRLYEQGEARYAQTPPIELLNNLLYYVARSSTAGPRVAAVRASFRLNELLPVDDSIEQERENLSAPSVKLMHTVAAAIREDLARVKDVLDIFVRRGGGQVEELAPQIELLRKIGDTLGVLGLGELRDARAGSAHAARGRGRRVAPTADEATLVQVAASADPGRGPSRRAAGRPDHAAPGAARRRGRPRPTAISSRCRAPCCASASSTWRASRRASRRTSAARSMRSASTAGRSSCAASRPAC